MVICTDDNVRQYLMEVSFYKVQRTLPFTHTYIHYINHNYEVVQNPIV